MKHLLLGATAFGATAARADWMLLPGEATTVSWPSGEGLVLRVAPGARIAWGGHRSIQVTHGMDVLARTDAYHHWEAAYGDGPNGAYLGTRYQNQEHVEQFEAGVTLGAPFANFGVGVIYAAAERKLQAVTVRGTFPLLLLPLMLYGSEPAKKP